MATVSHTRYETQVAAYIDHANFGRPYKVWEAIIGLESVQVIGVLHDKYLFKTRPRPLISKPDSSRKR